MTSPRAGIGVDEARYRADLRLAVRHRASLTTVLSGRLQSAPGHPEYRRLTGVVESRAGRAASAWAHFASALEAGTDPALLAHLVDHGERHGWHPLVAVAMTLLPGDAFAGPPWPERRYRLAVTGRGGHRFDRVGDVFNPTLARAVQRSRDERLPLAALSGWGYLDTIETVWVIGAHRFEEKETFDRLLPRLSRIVLFEPHPATVLECQARHRDDTRVQVVHAAVSDRTGEADFHLSSNDGLSSSLLPFGEHERYAPSVSLVDQVRVPTVTWSAARRRFDLPAPQLLVIDAQGAEYAILSAIPARERARIGVIYTEASTRPIYRGAATLARLDALLRRSFARAGFFPIRQFKGVHGNALFVNRQFLAARSRGRRAAAEAPGPRSGTAAPHPDEAARLLAGLRLQPMVEAVARHRSPDGAALFLWGAGAYGQQVLRVVRALGLRPSAFVDRDASKWESVVDGLPVISPEQVFAAYTAAGARRSSRPYVIVSTSMRDSVVAELSSRGLQPTADYFVPVW